MKKNTFTLAPRIHLTLVAFSQSVISRMLKLLGIKGGLNLFTIRPSLMVKIKTSITC
jgi:hypothetical protein